MNATPMKILGRKNFQVQPHELTELVTPEDKQYILYHLGVPSIPTSEWKLQVTGQVERSLKISFDDLAAMPQSTFMSFQECAGSPIRPTVAVRRTSQIVWTGVPLKYVLALAGVKEGPGYVWATGLDHGVYDNTNQGVDEYQKDLPLGKAFEDSVILATALNGKPLSEEKGGPVRLVVPGFYSTCSVKWIGRIEIQPKRSSAYFAEDLYNDTLLVDGAMVRRRVWEVAPHSVIVSPGPGSLGAAASTEIWGWAWGAQAIARVDVSLDNGVTWQEADLEPRQGWQWQRFSMKWQPRAGHSYELACRATDVSGTAQPDSGARNDIFRSKVSL